MLSGKGACRTALFQRHHRNAARVRYRGVCKLHPAALRHRLSQRVKYQMPAAARCLKGFSVRGRFQLLVLIQPYGLYACAFHCGIQLHAVQRVAQSVVFVLHLAVRARVELLFQPFRPVLYLVRQGGKEFLL